MEVNQFLLEQYKLVRERTSKHEDASYQLLILNVTAFGAILGLGKTLSEPLVPFSLLAILLICSVRSISERLNGKAGTAYLIERYGSEFNFDTYESGSHSISKSRFYSQESSTLTMAYSFAKIILDPFTVLTLVSLISGYAIGYQYWHTQLKTGKYLFVFCYFLLVALGHLPVIYMVIYSKKITIEHLRGKWREYINSTSVSQQANDYSIVVK